MQPWVGRPADELIQAWGAPNLVMPLSDGRRVLTWSKVYSDAGTGKIGECKKSVTVNTAGMIESWSSSGCKPIWVEGPI